MFFVNIKCLFIIFFILPTKCRIESNTLYAIEKRLFSDAFLIP